MKHFDKEQYLRSKDLVALVTGGASGLGKATVERLASQGAKVVVCDLPTSQGRDLETRFGQDNVVFSPCDVRAVEHFTL